MAGNMPTLRPAIGNNPMAGRSGNHALRSKPKEAMNKLTTLANAIADLFAEVYGSSGTPIVQRAHWARAAGLITADEYKDILWADRDGVWLGGWR